MNNLDTLKDLVVEARKIETLSRSYGAAEQSSSTRMAFDHLNNISQRVCALVRKMIGATTPIGIYRHRNGGIYHKLGTAIINTTHTIKDRDRVIVYRSDDGLLWVRSETEFNDGRFVPVHSDDGRDMTQAQRFKDAINAIEEARSHQFGDSPMSNKLALARLSDHFDTILLALEYQVGFETDLKGD